jgi:hypothetical protein
MEVERNVTRNQSRRDCYFNALLSDLERYRNQDDRTMTEDYPWDDEGRTVTGETNKRKRSLMKEAEGDSSTLQSSSINETRPPLKKTLIPPLTPQKHRTGDSLASLNAPFGPSGAISSSSSPLPNTPTPSPSSLNSPALNKSTAVLSDSSPTPSKPLPKRVVCLSNLYWVGKIGRPCIYYGNPGEESELQINVLPISVTTYQYDVRVRCTEISELNQTNLILCSDEKTREFAQALLKFYEWDKARMKEFYVTKEHLSADRVDIILNKPYIWPDLILDLIAHREKWVPWSKGVEKRLSFMTKQKGQSMRCLAYFEKLREQYLESMEAQIDLHSGSESENDEVPPAAGVPSSSSSSSSSSSTSVSSSAVIPPPSLTVTPVGRKKRKEKQKKVVLVEGNHSQDLHLPPSPEMVKEEGKDRKRKGRTKKNSHREELSSKFTSDAHPPTGSSQNYLDLFPSKLYWYPKFSLPAIFYDDPSLTFTETSSICIYPISTVTSRYYLETKMSDLQPLNLFNLSKCAEERTKEFVQSLIRFYDWRIEDIHKANPLFSAEKTQTGHLLRQDQAVGSNIASAVERGTSSSEANGGTETETGRGGGTGTGGVGGGGTGRGFLWPDFILNMISNLRLFNAFNRRAEKRLGQIGIETLTKKYGNPSAVRVQNYFETLQECYHENKYPLSSPPPQLMDQRTDSDAGRDAVDIQTEPELRSTVGNQLVVELTSITPEPETLDFMSPCLGSSCDYPVVIASPSPQSVPQSEGEEDDEDVVQFVGSTQEGGPQSLLMEQENL